MFKLLKLSSGSLFLIGIQIWQINSYTMISTHPKIYFGDRKTRWPLFATRQTNTLLYSTSSSSSSQSMDEASTLQDSSTQTTSTTNSIQKQQQRLDMPWSEWQEWALNDNLPKYLIHIPGNNNNNNKKNKNKNNHPNEHYSFALWHTMIRDVTELSGYDVGFVRKMHAQSLKAIKQPKALQQEKKIDDNDEDQDNDKDQDQVQEGLPKITFTPAILPLLDDFQFEPNGGITGKVFGLAGIANGAMIQTPPLDQSQLAFTIPNGYVMLQLEDNDDDDDDDDEYNNNGVSSNPIRLAYELGNPLIPFENGVDDLSINTKEKRYRMLKTLANTVTSTTLTSSSMNTLNSLNVNTIAAASTNTASSTSMLVNNAIDQGSDTVNGLIENIQNDSDTTEMLVKIGGLTSFLLAGATIMNAFHHHLTVNVFWV